MQQAIVLAKDASHFGDVPVGALIVNEQSEILGTGKNLREKNNDPTAHAEIIAIKNAGDKISNWRLDGLTMVVTLEPCMMCAGAILETNMKRLVFGAYNEKNGAAGSVVDLLRNGKKNNRFEVVSGVLSDESAKILKFFFESLRDGRYT